MAGCRVTVRVRVRVRVKVRVSVRVRVRVRPRVRIRIRPRLEGAWVYSPCVHLYRTRTRILDLFNRLK